MKNLKHFSELNEAKKVPTAFVPPIDESVAGSSDALVVYFDYDLTQGFGAEVKKIIDKFQLETISIKGNILVVSEGEGPKGGIAKFKKEIGI